MRDEATRDALVELVKSGDVMTFGGVGIAIAAVLLLILRVLLPRSDRRQIRIPLTMLLLHVLVVLLRVTVPEESAAQQWLSVTALFLILAAIGNSAFLLSIDWFVGRRLGRPLPRIFRDIIGGLVYVVVAFITLRAVGVEPGSILTTSALLTAVIALSLQDTLGNLFAGLALEAQRPFAVGDWIQFDENPDHVGRVTEMNWRATKILTNDAVEVIIPNGALAKMPIVNFTQPTAPSRRKVTLRAPLDVPVKRVQDTILKALEGVEQVERNPAPLVMVSDFLESAVEYSVYFYIADFEARLRIESLVRSRIWYALSRAGLALPYPVRDVRMRDASREAELAREKRIADREQQIRNVDFLDVLAPEAVRELAQRTQIRLFTAGEPIIVQGEAGEELFIVRSGEVSVVLHKAGNEVEVARLGPGKFFGEMSLMTGEKRSATVRAVGECEMLVIGHSAFKSILMAYPEAVDSIGKSLSGRQAQLEARGSTLPAPGADRAEEHEGALLTRIRSFFKL